MADVRSTDGVVLVGEDLRLEIASAVRTLRHRSGADILSSLIDSGSDFGRSLCSKLRGRDSVSAFSRPTLTVKVRQKGATAVKELIPVWFDQGAET